MEELLKNRQMILKKWEMDMLPDGGFFPFACKEAGATTVEGSNIGAAPNLSSLRACIESRIELISILLINRNAFSEGAKAL